MDTKFQLEIGLTGRGGGDKKPSEKKTHKNLIN